MVHHYTVEQKREMFRCIVTRLAAIGIRREDTFIGVTENAHEAWHAQRPYAGTTAWRRPACTSRPTLRQSHSASPATGGARPAPPTSPPALVPQHTRAAR